MNANQVKELGRAGFRARCEFARWRRRLDQVLLAC